ncbi:hypothetical protein [Bacillus sp. FJAT-49736]|uniref:hypothetical protein n=1 Tax=Bacillus sp. FJAT-49736 TaxID=2833582 RepID=UPI001BC9AB19|nr:hypothetical protein [Bacillus sp. FJAT-49736]MBS4174309.1 hypothetical protein [Bacillus sp. FJAT-49736]
MSNSDYSQKLRKVMYKHNEIFADSSTGTYEVYAVNYVEEPLKALLPLSFQKVLKYIAANSDKFIAKVGIKSEREEDELFNWLLTNTKQSNSFDLIFYIPEEFWPSFRYDSENVIDEFFVKGYIEMDQVSCFKGEKMPLDFEVFDVPLKDVRDYLDEQEVIFIIEYIASFLSKRYRK